MVKSVKKKQFRYYFYVKPYLLGYKKKYPFHKFVQWYRNNATYMFKTMENTLNIRVNYKVTLTTVDFFYTRRKVLCFDIKSSVELPLKSKKELTLNDYARSLSDPDDDGNYPVKLNNKQYLVSGNILFKSWDCTLINTLKYVAKDTGAIIEQRVFIQMCYFLSFLGRRLIKNIERVVKYRTANKPSINDVLEGLFFTTPEVYFRHAKYIAKKGKCLNIISLEKLYTDISFPQTLSVSISAILEYFALELIETVGKRTNVAKVIKEDNDLNVLFGGIILKH